MRRAWVAVAVLLTTTGVTSIDAASARVAASETAQRASYIVTLRARTGDPGQLASAQAGPLDGRVESIYRHALRGYSVTLSPTAARRLAADPGVASVTPDETFTAADTQPPQYVPAAQRRIAADESSAVAGDGGGSIDLNVAVIDTGIDPTHPDLDVAGGVDCSRKNQTSFADDNGHGTLVAGLIGAKDNGIGVVGVAPGVHLWSVKVLNKKGVGNTAELICGLDWVVATRSDSDPTNDISIANFSLAAPLDKKELGRDCTNAIKPFHAAMCQLVASGVVAVAAAGNESKDLDTKEPAAFREVLTATAMDDVDGLPGGLAGSDSCLSGNADDAAASFSNYTTTPAAAAHTVAAPGVCTTSTYPGGLYGYESGTSFASPLTAGVVALCLASGSRVCAGLRPEQIIARIVSDSANYGAANPDYGFLGDPQHAVAGRSYGNLIRAGLY